MGDVNMPFIKEKKFNISSSIDNLNAAGLPDGEPEVTRLSPEGFFKVSEDCFTVSYAEETEGGRVLCDIEIYPDIIKVIRHGAVESELHFSEGLAHTSLYGIPPYTFDMRVFTKRIRKNLTNDGGRVDIFYQMTVGGAEKSVRMRIEVC